MQDAPQRILYTSFYATDSVEEDNMEHIIIIVLASFFVLVLICVCYDVYRVNKKYKERKEFETDASILLSKQQAAIMLQENNKPVSFIVIWSIKKRFRTYRLIDNFYTFPGLKVSLLCHGA